MLRLIPHSFVTTDIYDSCDSDGSLMTFIQHVIFRHYYENYRLFSQFLKPGKSAILLHLKLADIVMFEVHTTGRTKKLLSFSWIRRMLLVLWICKNVIFMQLGKNAR